MSNGGGTGLQRLATTVSVGFAILSVELAVLAFFAREIAEAIAR